MNRITQSMIVAMMLMGSASLSGCNTVEGAGKDIERAGEKVQNSNCTKQDKQTDPNCNKQ